MKTLRLLTACVPFLLANTAGCSGETSGTDEADSALTSVTARARDLKFTGYVYVSRGASDSTILSAVRTQTQTAFGALRTAQVGVNSRELKDVDPKTFVKNDVLAVDTSTPAASGTPMTRVRYTYTDRAILPVSMAKRSALSVAVMGATYSSQTHRILGECTANDMEAQEFEGSIWYVFDPSLASCQTAMTAEQKAIDGAKKKLANATTQVSLLEVNRLYLPITVKLGADRTNKGESFPEYDRLFAGGVQKNKVVVGLLNGFIDHGAHDDNTDSGYGEWMDEVRASMVGHEFKLVKIEPSEDLTTLTVGTKTLTGLSFQSILDAEGGTFPNGLTSDEQTAFKKAAGDKIIKHWITLEATTKVTIGRQAPQDLGIQLYTYFGVQEESEIYKQAIKSSDVFLYNGHSYIGYGPLDPSNFASSDFSSTYQLMFIDGCVSYNYYEKDYFPLKSGETRNLELITNGIEAPSYHSGLALGLFVSMLVDGKQHSYRDLLVAAQETDPLRVVDGEVDNVYSPTKTPISFH